MPEIIQSETNPNREPETLVIPRRDSPGIQELIDDMDDDELASFALDNEKIVGKALQNVRLAKLELNRRAAETGAKEIATARVLVTIKPPKREYVWDGPELARVVKPMLSADEWISCVEEIPPSLETTYKVHTTKLLGLAERRKGYLLESVNKVHHVNEIGMPTVELKEREPDDTSHPTATPA